MKKRAIEMSRATAETDITLNLELDGQGELSIDTGLGFLDHMLTALAKHAGWNLKLTCQGDLQVDDHHTVEDCFLVLGRALSELITTGPPIARFGWARLPMDDALADVALDFGGRPYAQIELGLKRSRLGEVATENLTHAFTTLAMEARCNLHLEVVRGINDHHRAEAAFKGLALALEQALRIRPQGTRSTKEVIG